MSRFIAASTCLLLVLCSASVGTSRVDAATAPQTDVMFVFDTSGSMEPVLEEAKREIQNVMTQVGGVLPNVDFGLAEARDYGGSSYDPESDDEPWKLDVPVTSNLSVMTDAISGLYAEGGGDAPEAYGRALWETDTNPNVGWRSGARHLIILVADEVPHNANLDEGIPEEFWAEPSPWNTGEELPGGWGIPGTQLKEGETLDFHSVLRQLAADGKPLETVDYHDTSVNYIHYWEYWAALAGGTAVETSEGGQEFTGKLVGLVENAPEDSVCATTAVPSEPSPNPPSALPAALTPRFGQPGSAITLTPASGKEFCAGQQPYLGGSAVTAFEEFTPSKLTFRVPPTAASELTLSNLFGVQGPQQTYAVDNFREPWGSSIINAVGNGDKDFDSHISITRQDLESVFAGLGGPKTAAYKEAERDAEEVLHGGLCYGFSLLSWELYLDAHGNTLPLGWSNWSGSTLTRGQQPIKLLEETGGSHALTHDLLRAAVSQYSPEAEERYKVAHSAAELATMLSSGFSRGQPVPLTINWKEGGFLGLGAKHEGHELLAYDYQASSGGGIAVDVVDPNVPTWVSPQTEAYPRLQVNVNADGSWNYVGSFLSGTYKNPVSEGSGSLEVAVDPRVPGNLNIPANVKHWWDIFTPDGGATLTAISYGADAGHGFPGDVKTQGDVADTFTQRLLVPPTHHVITATIEGPAGASTDLTGAGFIDTVGLGVGAHPITLNSTDGSLSVPLATSKTALSVTRVSGGVQYTAEARFSGEVKRPTMTVAAGGAVTITTAGGNGSVSLNTGTYLPNGKRTVNSRSRTRLHGRTQIHLHTPKVKRRKHKRSKHRRRHRR